jgi:hypothetical protein
MAVMFQAVKFVERAKRKERELAGALIVIISLAEEGSRSSSQKGEKGNGEAENV